MALTSYIGYIYEFRNKANGKVYIGQTINPTKRYKQHIAYSKKDKIVKSPKFYNALSKYGEEGFDFTIIDTVIEKDIESLRSALTVLECHYIDKNDSINNGYNTGNAGLAVWTGLKMSDETKKKMSDTRKGKKHSAEWIDRIRTANLGKKRSEEYKKQASLIKSIPVNQYDAEGNYVMTHSSAYAATLLLNVKDHTSIGKCCKGLRETAHKYKWAYTNNTKLIKIN